MQKLAVEIERIVPRPGLFDDVDPFLRVIVARVVLALLDSEHVEFAFVPSAHDIHAHAALANMVGGDELLGGDQRMKQRRMHGAEHRNALGGAEEADRPGNGLQRGAMKIGLAAVALPARNRQQEVGARLRRRAAPTPDIPARSPPNALVLWWRSAPMSSWRRTGQS